MHNFSLIRVSIRHILPLLLGIVVLLSDSLLRAQTQSWPERAVNTAIALGPDVQSQELRSNSPSNADLTLLLSGVGAAWYNTANGAYYRYEKQKVDSLLATRGDVDPKNDMAMARAVLLVGRVTQDPRYFRVATILDQRLDPDSRATAPQQGASQIYESAPFYAEYAQILEQSKDFAGITKLFSKDSREMNASFAKTDMQQGNGNSIFATGWYMMAMVDTLPYYPHNDPGRGMLLHLLNQTAAKIVQAQDKNSGLWHEGSGKPDDAKDAIATFMFTYALQKAVRLGYLDESYAEAAALAWRGTLKYLVRADGTTSVSFMAAGTNKSSHDPGNVSIREESGAFLLASMEMERASQSTVARGQTVTVDSWFNSQQRTNGAGKKEYFHYKWNDYSDSGYSLLGNIFSNFGADLATLSTAPTLTGLKKAQYYIIVSPDIPAKNPVPHYVQAKDADQVTEWVRRGGVLLLMENDPPNADIQHLNLIADRFGIHFNSVLSHHVVGDDFAAGQIPVEVGGPIFHRPHTLYMKDTCTLSLRAPAVPLLKDKDSIVIAMAKFGKGTVVAVVDPWLYNEYTDGRKKVPMQDNYAAGVEFVRWLINQRSNDLRHLMH